MANTIYQKGRKIIIVKPALKDWEGGVIIVCKRCGDAELVRENSLCDLWKFCRKCASAKLSEFG